MCWGMGHLFMSDTVSNSSGWPQTPYLPKDDLDLLILLPPQLQTLGIANHTCSISSRYKTFVRVRQALSQLAYIPSLGAEAQTRASK